MPLLDQNAFIVELGKLFDKQQTAGSVFISMSMVDSATKVKDDLSKTPVTEPRCMIRATDGASGKKKTKFSTILSAKDVPQFNKTLAVVIKSHTDALKKKEKKKKAGNKTKV